ncbi:hypothetical protein F4860DRAFT_242380 [Xylaria cubensis]|nr:hypothetical protein F4860DRAFT_242380 [Xylaria cubensis]
MPLPQGIGPCPAPTQSFPPEEYVKTDRTWHYDPCPSIFVEADIHHSFLTQMLGPDHAFSSIVWWNLFPKKLNEKYTQEQEDNIGWCVHIIEGINWAILVWLCLVIILLSGLVAVVYAKITGDHGTAWTIAGWLAASLGLFITCLQLFVKGVI